MLTSFQVAWYQLSYHKVKLATAASGVVVAVMLMLVQLGIRQGAIDNSTAIVRLITADVVLISPRSKSIFQSATPISRALIYRLPAHPAVEEVQCLTIGQAKFRHPWEQREFPITVYGLDPRDPMMALSGIERLASTMELRDRVIFDGLSRTTYGPIVETFAQQPELTTEINYRKMVIAGTISVGISFNTDGNLYTTHSNFLRLFPTRSPSAIDVGLVRLRPTDDVPAVLRALQDLVGPEAVVMTKDALVASEVAFLRESAPLDFIFGLGTAIGFFIGFVVVYQILYTEVTNHLPHFATMKAMGFTDGYLLKIVVSQSLILSVMGYLPGFVLAIGVYRIATKAIQMPFEMTTERAVMVLLLTMVMCGISAMMAIQKARTADPADVF